MVVGKLTFIKPKTNKEVHEALLKCVTEKARNVESIKGEVMLSFLSRI